MAICVHQDIAEYSLRSDAYVMAGETVRNPRSRSVTTEMFPKTAGTEKGGIWSVGWWVLLASVIVGAVLFVIISVVLRKVRNRVKKYRDMK